MNVGKTEEYAVGPHAAAAPNSVGISCALRERDTSHTSTTELPRTAHTKRPHGLPHSAAVVCGTSTGAAGPVVGKDAGRRAAKEE